MQMELSLAQDSSTIAHKSQTGQDADGPSPKMSPVFSASTRAGILRQWLEHYVGPRSLYLPTGGEMPDLQSDQKDSSNGSLWTRNLSVHNHTHVPFPNDGSVSSLSEILEIGPVASHYYLSPKACRGILRRAEARGKTLPEALRLALKAVADSEPTSNVV